MALTVTQLNKQLKEGVKGLYIFTGEEQFLISSYLQRIEKAVLDGPLSDFNKSVFEGKDASFEEFVSELNTYPQMSEKKLIILKNTEFLTTSEYQSAMERLLGELPDFSVVVFVEDDIKKIKKNLLKIIESVGIVAQFERQSAADLRSWVNRRISGAGKRMKNEDIELLVNLCERSLDRLIPECDKLVAAAGDSDVITKKHIDDLVFVPLEFKIYAVAQSLLAKNSKEAYIMLREFKTNKEQPTVVISLIYSLFASLYMFKKIKRAADFLPQNRKFLATRYASDSARRNEAELRRAMRLCAAADEDIKSGKIEAWTALELVMAQILKKPV
ncbi:MAG: DNA polymerase III subunit delta [Firmicutes bacterium ADurb.Bin193]|nr:MAG: DNA polymerase III subunit delta [Firmicutes bacterium ADurb.Bin193]